MSIDERRRHDLYQELDSVLGTEHADTLMAHLPPTGWADVATKGDLRLLAAELRAEMSGLRAEMAELRVELHDSLRQQLWAIMGSLFIAVLVSNVVTRLG
jgi:hypothetical protein